MSELRPGTTQAGVPNHDIARDFPLLWEKAQHADFSERSGYTPEPLVEEAARALREIWDARRYLESESRNV